MEAVLQKLAFKRIQKLIYALLKLPLILWINVKVNSLSSLHKKIAL
jgi:hypothetical protein